MATWTNTVPQGAIGTGNAQVFDNPVAAQFGSQLQNLRRQEEIKAQQLAKQMRDNELAVSGGTLWADQVANLEKAHITEGMELQKQGINPYTSMDPKAVQYRQARAEVTAKQKFREEAEKQAVTDKKFIRDNLDNLEPEDIQKYNDYLSNTKLDEAFAGNFAPPELRKRFDSEAFDKNIQAQVEREDIVKGSTRTVNEGVNREETEKTILAAYSSDGRGREQVLKVTKGLDPVKVKEDFAPTYVENKKRVLSEIEGIPGMKEALAKKNILPGTPAFEEYVSDTAEQYTKIRKDLDGWLNAKVDRVSSGVKSTRQVTPFRDPNEMTEYQRQSLDIQRQRENRMASEDGEGGAKSQAANARAQHITDILSMKPGAMERLEGIIKGDPGYTSDEKPFKKRLSKDNSVWSFHIPAKVTGNNVVPARDIVVDYKSPQAADQLNQLIGTVSGVMVDLGALGAKSSNAKKSADAVVNPNLNKPAEKQEKTVTFVLDGMDYLIPESKVAAFQKAKPKAKRK